MTSLIRYNHTEKTMYAMIKHAYQFDWYLENSIIKIAKPFKI